MIVGYTELSLCATALIPFSQGGRIVDIAALAFDGVSEEEKLRYQARIQETFSIQAPSILGMWCAVNYTALQ